MKKLLFVLALSISCNSYADWNAAGGYKWKYDCDSFADVTSVVFFLHEARRADAGEFVSSIIQADGSHPLFPPLLDSCSLLVAPESGVHPLEGINYYVWDYTGYFTYGRDVSQIIGLLVLAKKLFNKPVYLVGGAAGGIMAYRVATELTSLGHGGLLSGLVLMDMVSFRSLSVTENHPAGYVRLNSAAEYKAIGTEFYKLFEDKYTHVQLGFVSDAVIWAIPTLILYSREDSLLPEYLKEDFANKLQAGSTQTEVVISGIEHNIGHEGLVAVREWLFANY